MTRFYLAVKGALIVLFGHLKRQVLLTIMAGVLIILSTLFTVWAYTEIRWYMAINYFDVIATIVHVRFWMALLPFMAMTLFVIVNMNLARRLSPLDRVVSAGERDIDRWRRKVSPIAGPLITIIGLVCGLVIALATFTHWDTYLLYRHGVEWGRADPQFDRDLSYFMFRLPMYALVNRWAFIGVLVTLILTAITSYLFGGLRPQAPGAKIPPLVNIHISALMLSLIVLLGWSLLLALHLLSYSERGVITGLGYTDANASLVAYQFVATAVVTGFVLFQINIRKPGWILPSIAMIWLFMIGLSAARFYPTIYQLLIVEPQELEREHDHIASHLEFTRYGFGLDQVARRDTQGDMTLGAEAFAELRPTLERMRLWDPETLLIVFQELQALRTYYEFRDVDVDRYTIDGEAHLVMVAARELNERAIPSDARRWQAERLIYTHGFGLVAAAPAEATKAGLPVLHAEDLPGRGMVALLPDNPRIYYGENSPPYSFVDTSTIELDRPMDLVGRAERRAPPEISSQNDLLPSVAPLAEALDTLAGRSDEGDGEGASDEVGEANEDGMASDADAEREAAVSTPAPDGPSRGDTSCPDNGLGGSDSGMPCEASDVGFSFTDYTGVGGVGIDHIWDRLAFAIRFWDLRVGLTWLFDEDTKVMFHRRIRERVQRVAPYLKVDRNPYPVVADGRIQWIVDVYTMSDMMPYSKRIDLSDLTEVDEPRQDDTGLIPREFVNQDSGLSGRANYVRGSVKAVVDAYNGTVTLYVVDPDDKVLQSWRKVFPDSFVAQEEASEALRAHFRYPHDLFKIQSVVWSDYHMTTPETFYTREAAWRIPPDASFISLRRERQTVDHEGRRADLSPYWLLTRFPGDAKDAFAIVQPFSPAQHNVLTGYLVGYSDGADYGRLASYVFPATRTVIGPPQAQARIDQDERISAWVTLRMQSGSRVSRGRLLALPVGEALIYVQPLFVQADKSEVSTLLDAQLSSIPELKQVVLVYGDRVVMRPTLGAALEALFDPTAQEPTEEVVGETTSRTTDETTDPASL